MNNIKQILLFILGVIISIVFMFVFFYAFIFIAIIGLGYYFFRKFFKKRQKPKTTNKEVGPIIIDMEEDD